MHCGSDLVRVRERVHVSVEEEEQVHCGSDTVRVRQRVHVRVGD